MTRFLVVERGATVALHTVRPKRVASAILTDKFFGEGFGRKLGSTSPPAPSTYRASFSGPNGSVEILIAARPRDLARPTRSVQARACADSVLGGRSEH